MRFSILTLSFIFLACTPNTTPKEGQTLDTTPPTVVKTTPANNDQKVEPGPTVLSVTFSEPMMKGQQSWAQISSESFPKVTGMPELTKDGLTATLPVVLAPDTEYVVLLNTEELDTFKDKAGNSLEPYKLVFKTKSK